LVRKSISPLSALSQLILAVFPDFLAGTVEQAASLYTASFSKPATKVDTLSADPLSSMATPAHEMNVAVPPHAGATTSKANKHSSNFFMITFSLN
jgi:hypothetical protein